MNDKLPKELPDTPLYRSGYLQCQLDASEIILEREKVLFAKIKEVQKELESEKSLIKRQDLMIQVAKFTGEAETLRSLFHQLSSLKPSVPDGLRKDFC